LIDTTHIAFQGTEAECKKEENELVSYQVNNNLKGKISKQPKEKVIKENSAAINESSRLALLEDEIIILKTKLSEKKQ
jgi:urocanate hydratase